MVTEGSLSKKDAEYLSKEKIKVVYAKGVKDSIDVTDKSVEEVAEVIKIEDYISRNKVIIPCPKEVRSKLEIEGHNLTTIKTLYALAGVD